MKVTARKKRVKPRKTVTLTIRRLEPELGARLRARAAREGLSVEEHVRRTLRAAHPAAVEAESWVDGFRRRVMEITDGEGFEFDVPAHSPGGPAPDFTDY
jgi:predicted HicB family RNase H-like nuclease